VATACGWWARIGENLTYLVRWSERTCPHTLNDLSRVELLNYFANVKPSLSSTMTSSVQPSSSAPISHQTSQFDVFVALGLEGYSVVIFVVVIFAACALFLATTVYCGIKCGRSLAASHTTNITPRVGNRYSKVEQEKGFSRLSRLPSSHYGRSSSRKSRANPSSNSLSNPASNSQPDTSNNTESQSVSTSSAAQEIVRCSDDDNEMTQDAVESDTLISHVTLDLNETKS